MEREVALDPAVPQPVAPAPSPVDASAAARVAIPETPEAPPAWWLIPAFLLTGFPVLIGAAIFGSTASDPGKALIAMTTTPVAFLPPALVWARVSGFRVFPLLRLTRSSLAALLLGAGAAFAAVLAGYGLVNLLSLQGLLPESSGGPKALQVAWKHFPNPWVRFALFGLIPGLCEELFFRGALQTALLRRRSPAVAIALTAMLFAAIHLDLAGAPGRLIVALALGWLAWRTGSLWPGVLAHALYNGTAGPVLVALFGEPARMQTVPSSAAGLAVGILAFTLLALAARRWLPPAPAAASFLLPRVSTAVASSTEASAAGTRPTASKRRAGTLAPF
jgi:membrane protease YdiL (CAAX protease family)